MKRICFEVTDKYNGVFNSFYQLFKDDATEDEIVAFGEAMFEIFLKKKYVKN